MTHIHHINSRYKEIKSQLDIENNKQNEKFVKEQLIHEDIKYIKKLFIHLKYIDNKDLETLIIEKVLHNTFESNGELKRMPNV